MIVVPNDNMIRLYGKSMINVESQPVWGDDYDTLPELYDYMTAIMARRHGVGLAACQIGVFKRVVVINDGSGPKMYINPDIVGMYGKELPGGEACLSLPPSSNGCQVPRMQSVIVEHESLFFSGEKEKRTFSVQRSTVELNGIQAVIMQHEVDHLNGGFFIDRVQDKIKDRMIAVFNNWKAENLKHAKVNS